MTRAIDINEYIAQHFNEKAIEALKFAEHYGKDFNTFFYRSNFDHFLRMDALEFRAPNYQHNTFLDNNCWPVKNSLNFPGPFYTGESGTCGTGICEAPINILNDGENCEYIFRQPQTYLEFLCILDAAETEVLERYSCNGNDYWTYEKCRLWWRDKPDILNSLSKCEDNFQYEVYLNGAAEKDLKRYCFFLENGNYPSKMRQKICQA